MRIEAFFTLIAVVWLTALLWQPLVSANNVTITSVSRKSRDTHRDPLLSGVPEEHKQSYYKDIQEMLRREGNPVECCPSKVEVIQPVGGRNREGLYVELYRDIDNIQSFYEISCDIGVENSPCRFVDRKLTNQSKCIQKYSYSYALIKDFNTNMGLSREQTHKYRHNHFPTLSKDSPWRLDYVRVRSGCSCELTPKPPRTKGNKNSKKKDKAQNLKMGKGKGKNNSLRNRLSARTEFIDGKDEIFNTTTETNN